MDELKKNSLVDCSIEWLMYGIGDGPQIIYAKNFGVNSCHEMLSSCDDNERKQIQRELDALMAGHKDILIFMISDDSMRPHYDCGDIVAGTPLFEKDFQRSIGRACIIKDISGKVFFRQVEQNTRSLKLVFSVFNPSFKQCNDCLDGDNIICLAPVLWHRKSLKTLFL